MEKSSYKVEIRRTHRDEPADYSSAQANAVYANEYGAS
jgi:hypothetical protein